ncbi:hypothetical protein F5I97DRAFT_1408694 [Phlebopus sp. FC_14]|nr:hypothetical protein F5I97DRAFT_1408694 [Phlebopus sp. FC_14]
MHEAFSLTATWAFLICRRLCLLPSCLNVRSWFAGSVFLYFHRVSGSSVTGPLNILYCTPHTEPGNHCLLQHRHHRGYCPQTFPVLHECSLPPVIMNHTGK